MSAHKTAPEPVQGATAAADIFYGSWTLLLLLLLLAPDRRTFYPGTFRRVFSLAPQLRFFFLRRTTPLHHPSLTNTLAGLNQYQTTSRHPAAFHFSLCICCKQHDDDDVEKEKKKSDQRTNFASAALRPQNIFTHSSVFPDFRSPPNRSFFRTLFTSPSSQPNGTTPGEVTDSRPNARTIFLQSI